MVFVPQIVRGMQFRLRLYDFSVHKTNRLLLKSSFQTNKSSQALELRRHFYLVA